MGEHICFHRLEDYNLMPLLDRHPGERGEVIVSFETRQYGIYQIKYKRFGEGKGRLKEMRDEPNLMLFSEKEQQYIESLCKIIFRLMFNLDKPKGLSKNGSY